MTIYTSAFNLIKGGFEYLSSLDNFNKFADYVVVACNTSDDDTLKQLKQVAKVYPNLIIVECDFSYSNPLLDGKVKNFALQSAELLTPSQTMIGIDLDEKIPLNQQDIWRNLGNYLLPEYDSILIPSINLWGDSESVRWDEKKNRAYKWYLHRKGFNRGPFYGGLKEDGYLDITKSDGTELIDIGGNLTRSIRIDGHLDHITNGEEYFAALVSNNLPYVIHEGYLSLENRIGRNKSFWGEQWKSCSNDQTIRVPLTVEELAQYPTIKHNLPI